MVPHVVPHVPQFALSVCVFTHTLPQAVVPLAQQTPFEHTCPVPHAFPQTPQWLAVVCVLIQLPLQQLSPPATLHATPHDPQL